MAAVGQVLSGPGVSLRIDRLSDEVLEMEARYAGTGSMPPVHLHPSQDERFEVLEGAMIAVVDGEERRHAAGDVFEVPAGTPHQMAGDGPARFRWEVRPALRTAEFFERLYGGVEDWPSFLGEYAAEIRFPAS